MSDPTIFEQQPQQQPNTPDVFADQLNMIKNDKGEPKYESVPKALEALQHSQQYIPEIKSQLEAKEQEIAQLKEELSKAKTLDEVVDKVTASQAQAPVDTPAPQPALDEQAIIELLNSHSEQQRAATIAQTNEAAVSKALIEKFGDKAGEVLASKSQELGLSKEAMKSLAQQSPNAVLQFFGTAQTAAHSAPETSVRMPLGSTESGELEPPEKPLLSGAKYQDQLSYLNRVREAVYKKHGVET